MICVITPGNTLRAKAASISKYGVSRSNGVIENAHVRAYAKLLETAYSSSKPILLTQNNDIKSQR